MSEPAWYREAWDGQGAAISLAIRERLWRHQSRFQLVEVYETTHFGRLMTLDGLVMVTERDHFIYHEMLAHPALVTQGEAARVAIVGGGDCGLLCEVIKHRSVRQVTQVELDPAVTDAAKRFYPDLYAATADPRVSLRFGDGIAWMADAPSDSLDVLLIDSTDPVGPAQGLFAEPFLRECRRVLAPAGVLAMQSESPLFHHELIHQLHAELDGAGFRHTALLSFPQCTYPSGWWSVTLAGDLPLAAPAGVAPDLATRYYTPAVHAGALATPAFLGNLAARG